MEDCNNYKLYIVFESNSYKDIDDFHFGYAAAYHTNGVCGYIDLNGYEHILLNYKNIESFYGDIAPVLNNGLWGFIDSKFNEIIPCKYLFQIFYKSGFIVKSEYDDNFKAIDSNGNIIYSDSNIENVKKYLNKTNPIIEKDDIDIQKMEYRVLGTYLKSYSYINSNGEKIIEFSNKENRDFNNGYVVVKVENNDFRIFNKKGKKLKIHSCILESEHNNDLIKTLNFRISSKVDLDSKVKIIKYE